MPQAAEQPCERPAMVSVRDVSFTFPGRRSLALRHISLSIAQGEFVVITGASGCGKSTLALAMAGYIPHVIDGAMSGDVVVGGVGTTDVALCDLAVTVSLCQQDPESQLCTLRVRDEVCFGPENLMLPAAEVSHRKEEALQAIGSAHLAEREVYHLSGGEKQRVAIASMLAMHPRMLILDEPTSNLDPDAADEVLRAIEALRREETLTLVVIEHKLDRLMKIADRLIVMADGAIHLDGRPEVVHRRYTAGLHELRAAPPPAAPRVPDAPPRPIALKASDLWFKYGERAVLQGVSLAAQTGEFIGIIGANGSGKTTFLKCLAGLCRPTSGKIEIAGQQTGQVKVSTLARKIGFVFQNPNHQIFETTVADEVAFACKNFGIITAAKAVGEALAEYGLTPYEAVHPLRLSHGEKRRLNLCSVLPHDPAIIILDEPFIGQDAANMARMVSALLALKAAGRTVLVVSHDMEMVFRYCDRVVLFEAGRIVVDAPPEMAKDQIEAIGKLNFLPEARCS